MKMSRQRVMHRALVGAVAIAVPFLSPAVSSLAAQAPRDRLALEQYLDWEDVQSPRLSPDGKQVIYTRRWIDKINDRWESSLWIMGVDGSKNRFLVNGSDVEWSPDGQRIAYIAKGDPTGAQLFVRWMDAEGAISQVTRLTEAPSDITWSPEKSVRSSSSRSLYHIHSAPLLG